MKASRLQKLAPLMVGLSVVFLTFSLASFVRSKRGPPTRAEYDGRAAKRLVKADSDVVLQVADGSWRQLSVRRADSMTVVWWFPGEACVACLAEIDSWRQFRQDHPEIQIIGVAVGGDSMAVRQFARDEQHGIPILLDPTGRSLEMWQIEIRPPLRALFQGGEVIALDAGRTRGTMIDDMTR